MGHAVHALPPHGDARHGLRGVPIKSGDKVVTWFASSNRDEEAFDDPSRFDVGRDPNRHQGFGAGGPHYCLGSASPDSSFAS